MSKFEFSLEARLNAVAHLESNETGSVERAMAILEEDGNRRWHHHKRGSNYTEMAIGHLQIATTPPIEGDMMMVYVDEVTGRVYIRQEKEFKDGRFMELPSLDVEI